LKNKEEEKRKKKLDDVDLKMSKALADGSLGNNSTSNFSFLTYTISNNKKERE
jgi:hypothetical protein